jgi:CotH kinase protein/Lamin Tail Domain
MLRILHCMRKSFPPFHRIAALVVLGAAPLSAAPLITEFLASNTTGLKDQNDTVQDWIEIHNPDASAVDLEGYHLTDNPLLPMRWTFPAGVAIPAGGYLVVFASNKNRDVAGSELHTNFALSEEGEYLALNAPGGTPVLSSFAAVPQSADVSYGLAVPSPGSPPNYFGTPTPGAPNNLASAPAEAVQFTPTSRTFTSGTPLNVALSVVSPTATIRYTVNRSRPIGTAGLTGTFTADATTNVMTMTAHGLSHGNVVRVQSSGTLPVPLLNSIDYFVTVLTADTFKLSFAPGDPPLDLTSIGSGTLTLRRDASIANAAATDVFSTTVAHTFFNLDPVEVTTTGTLPGGVTADTTYYLVNVSPTSFRLSSSPTGTPVLDITAPGTGTNIVRRVSSPLYTGPIPVAVNTRVRARAFEPGRPDGPVGGEIYFALDAAALTFSSNLPVVITETWGVIPQSDIVVPAHFMIFEPKAPDNLARMTNVPDLAMPGSVERRGSSTAGDPKYSLTVETWDEANNDRNFPILGMPSDADWVMHAPYSFDRSFMHNDLIYLLSNDVGRWASRTRFVEHFHNTTSGPTVIGGALTGAADYFGVYSFMEKITRGEDRVDVERLTTSDNAPPAVQGGYMFKVDRLDPGDSGITPLAGQNFGGIGSAGWVYPKERHPDPYLVVTTAQSNYFRDYIGDAVASLQPAVFMNPATGYANFFDVGSVIDHQILNIAAKNVDANRLSAYWFKPRNGKLSAGPIWDFDRAEGSTDGRDFIWGTWRGDNGDLGTDFFHYPWFNQMFMDPNFWQAYIDRYHELRLGPLSTAHVHARIDEFANQLNPGNAASTPAKRSGTRWIGPRASGSNTAITNNTFNGQYTGEIAWLKYWWQKRLEFMDGQFTRPAVASLPPGPVAPGSQVTLTSPSLSTPGVKILYTTNGTDPRPAATAPEPGAGTGVTIATFLPEIGTVRAIVPTSATTGGPNGTEWRGTDLNANGNNADDFADAAWFTNAAGTINGVGYDDNTAVNYLPFVSVRWHTATVPVAPSDATNTMRTSGAITGNQTCFGRWAFTLSAADLANLVSPNKLVLQVRYDDGFAAWLNGTELTSARPNAPASASLTWSSAATTTHDDTASTFYSDFDITAFISSLHAGTNVLAIQGLNAGLGSSDFVLQPKLVVQAPPPPYTPAVSTDAVEYSAPITINAPTQLFVRTVNPVRPSDPPTQNGGGTGAVPNGSSWSAPTKLYFFPGAVAASQATIQITEVLYHPAPPAPDEVASGFDLSNDFEFVRLTNTGAVPVDLTGIFFSNGIEFTAVPGLQNWLPAGQSVVVVENTAAFIYRYGSTFTILGQFQGELNDGGDHIVLNDKAGAVISDFRYDDTNPWPVPADNGYSLLYMSGDPNLAGSWRVSLDPGGTSANTYARWLRRYYPNGDIPFQPMTQDDDGDGLNNFGEYAFATDPRTPGSAEHSMATIVPGSNPARLAVRRRRGATDVTWTFETSLNAADWNSAGAVLENVVSNGDGTETATWRAPAFPGVSRIFLRTKATNP